MKNIFLVIKWIIICSVIIFIIQIRCNTLRDLEKLKTEHCCRINGKIYDYNTGHIKFYYHVYFIYNNKRYFSFLNSRREKPKEMLGKTVIVRFVKSEPSISEVLYLYPPKEKE